MLILAGPMRAADSAGTMQKDLFVVQQISSENLYVNEEAILTILFYHKGKVINARLKIPDHKGLNTFDLNAEKAYESTVDGRSYMVTEFRFSLFPASAGEHWLRPVTITCQTLDRPHPLLAFKTGKTEKKEVSVFSNAIKLQVIPLPPPESPQGASKLVGSFTLKAALSRTSISQGDPINLVIKIRGTGNLFDMAALALPRINGCRTFPDKPLVEIKTTAGGLSGTQTYRFGLIPEKAGAYNVTPLNLVYFDPRNGSYIKLVSPSLHFEAKKKPNHNNASAPIGHSPQSCHNWSFTVMVALFFLLLGGLFIFLRRRQPDKIAETTADRAISVPAFQINPNSFAHLATLHRAFKNTVGKQLDMNTDSFTTAEIAKLLNQSAMPAHFAGRIVAILEKFDSSRYSRTGPEKGLRRIIIDEIMQLSVDLTNTCLNELAT